MPSQQRAKLSFNHSNGCTNSWRFWTLYFFNASLHHILWEIIYFWAQELLFLTENTRFLGGTVKNTRRLFRMLPVVFRGLSGVVFRFSRVVVWLSMLSVLRTFWFLTKNQQRSMISGPSSDNQKSEPPGTTDWLHQISNGDSTGRVLRNVSVFFTVQT